MRLYLGSLILWLLWRPREIFYRFSKARYDIANLSEARARKLVKVEVGGGENPRMKQFDFINMDIREVDNVDIVGRAWELADKLDGEKVGYIYTRHVLEHLAEYELEKTLKNWREVVQRGCIIEIIVPNITFHISQIVFAAQGSEALAHGVAGFNGWQRCEGQNYWDVHKNIFTEKKLLIALRNHFSFSQIKFDRSMGKNIHFWGVTE